MPSPWDVFEKTKKKVDVFRFLLELGYPVGTKNPTPTNEFSRTLQRKLDHRYQDPQGFFTPKLVRKFVRENNLFSPDDTLPPAGEEAGGLAVEKLKADLLASQERGKMMRIQRLKAEGQLGSRKDFELGLAARVAVLDQGIRLWITQKSLELIAVVKGKIDLKHDFEQFFIAAWTDRLNEYAKPVEFDVLFENSVDDEAVFSELEND